jgi:AcrR family transcriptional regulator
MTTTSQGPAISADAMRDRQLIVQAAIDCFVQQGVTETSMEDIVQKSGLSSAAVLGYFPRKNDVLRVVGAANKAAAAGMLTQLLQETPVTTPDEMLGRSATFFSAGGDAMRIVPQAWGVALADEEINGVMRDVLMSLQDQWVELASRMAAEGQLPDGADPEDVGRTLGCIIIGYMVQSMLSDVSPEHIHRGLKALVR